MSVGAKARVSDAQIARAKEVDLALAAEQLGVMGLKRLGREITGPCPACGGKDRFSLAPDRGVYNCRTCGGGDVIGLVRLVRGCDFVEAVLWLVGEESGPVDPELERRRARERAEAKRRQEAESERRREAAIRSAQVIWSKGQPPTGAPVAAYLARRGLPPSIAATPPVALRYHATLAYLVGEGSALREIHRGPAMIAAVREPSSRITAVHRTWLDLDRPNGKAVILDPQDPEAGPLPAKKVWGSKKGAAIRLHTPKGWHAAPYPILVMGEGIETTLTALAAVRPGDPFDPLGSTAFWAGIDLGNMAGRRLIRGEGSKFAGIPDLDDDEAFVPPPWVKQLVFIQDGDSEPRLTRAKLMAGLRRAKARIPGLERISIVHAGEGRDLNDILMEGDA